MGSLEAFRITWFCITAGAVMGAVLASWLCASAYRLRRRLDIVHARSECDHCDTQVRNFDNVPIIGWLLLMGRCRSCKERIPARYLAFEVLGAIVGGLLGWWGTWPLVIAAVAALVVPLIISIWRRPLDPSEPMENAR